METAVVAAYPVQGSEAVKPGKKSARAKASQRPNYLKEEDVKRFRRDYN